MIGQIFGKLTVAKHISKTVLNRDVYLCICECGTELEVTKTDLEISRVYSCGCYTTPKGMRGNVNPSYKGTKDIGASVLTALRYSAKKRNIEVNLTLQDIQDLYDEQNGRCIYTNWDIHFKGVASQWTGSIDRIDSALPYTKTNIQLVEKRVNLMKGMLTDDAFLSRCVAIVNNMK